MKCHHLKLILLILAFSSLKSYSKEIEFDSTIDGFKFLSWNSLNMIQEVESNPFESLSNQQFDLMRLYARNRISMEEEQNDENSLQLQQTAKELQQKLQQYDLDANALYETRNRIMEQRLTQMYTPNPNVIGKEWSIAGFMAPIELDGMKVKRFFLVPTAGACIHMPPPPPNQIILVNLDEGVDITNLGDAYWVKGKVKSEVVTGIASYYDGESTAEAIYTMNASEIHKF